MMGPLVLGAVVLFVGVALVVVLHRDLTRFTEHLAESQLDRSMNQLWDDVKRLHDQDAGLAAKRLRDIEIAVTRVKQVQGELERYVRWMAPWVHHWASTDSDQADQGSGRHA